MPSNSNNSKPHQAAQEQADLPPPAAATSELDMALLLPKEQSVVLVCDVVESVRWMEHDEDNAIARWSQFASQVREQLAPAHEGRVVKSTGDGLMIEFKQAPQAVAAAHALHTLAQEGNQRLAAQTPERQLHLRVGIHQAEVRRDAHDLYGHGVNLAARITTLAGPGEIIVTPEVRDHITDSLDGQIEDMGECYFKHLQEPQRVYRVEKSKTQVPSSFGQSDLTGKNLWPTVAVMPFKIAGDCSAFPWIGEVLGDALVTCLSSVTILRVLSRLSSFAFGGREDAAQLIAQKFSNTYTVSGRLVGVQGKLLVYSELQDMRDGSLCWTEQFLADPQDLTSKDSQVLQRLSAGISTAITQHVASINQYQPLPQLTAQSLLLGSVTSMHKSTSTHFEASRSLLDELSSRYSRHGSIQAWLGKWYVLKVMRGLSQDTTKDSSLARWHASKAIDMFPQDAHALAVNGHVLCQMSEDGSAAAEAIDMALHINPSDPYAWLYKSVWSTMWGSNQDAVDQALKAKELSPVDPMSYYFDMILAFAYAYSSQYEKAIELAQKSLTANRHHAPTLRALLLAQVESEQIDNARSTLKLLLKETPDLTLTSYQKMGNFSSPARQRVYRALQTLNLQT
jgi:adenylate cyclase